MNTELSHSHRAFALLGLALGIGVSVMAACAANPSPQGGGHVEPRCGSTDVDAGDGGTAHPAGSSTGDRGLIVTVTPSEDLEDMWGIEFTPAEKAIVNSCPGRSWSKDVPDRDCKKDSECGDGFCDRGHCEEIWGCGIRIGGPCRSDLHCNGVCIEGRCRSCISDDECKVKAQKKYDRPAPHPHAECGDPRGSESRREPGRECALHGMVL